MPLNATSRTAAAARSHTPRSASKCVNNRNRETPAAAFINTPRSFNPALNAAPLKPVPETSKNKIFVTGSRSTFTPGIAAKAPAKYRQFSWSTANRATIESNAINPAAANTPTCRIPPPNRFRNRRPLSISKRGPANIDPAGAPNPFDKQNITVSTGATISLTGTPEATEAKWKDITTRLSRRPVASKYLDKDDLNRFIEAGNTVNRLKDLRNGYDPLAVNAVKKQLSDAEMKTLRALDQRARELKRNSQEEHDKVLTYAENSREPEPSPILTRGSVMMKGELTQLGFLDALTATGYQPDLSARAAQPEAKTTFQRTALATWITDPERGAGHLLARVMVNRLWQHHFGQGLVRTPNDFGTQGDTPALPDLFDWLAGEFIRSGWSVKHMQRLLLTSAVYRQTTDYDEARAKLDPANSTWWRRGALRMESEILRDSILATSGTLNDRLYGPGIMMPIPKEAIITRSGTPYPTDITDEPRIRRRSIYAYTKRTVPVPLLQVFDGADSSVSCGERIPTTVPTQALILLNNDMIRARSFDFADRLLKEAPGSLSAQIKRAYELALARVALPEETARMEKFYREQLSLRNGDSRSTLADVCQVVFNLNEFIYVN